jgi:hypothetical protein
MFGYVTCVPECRGYVTCVPECRGYVTCVPECRGYVTCVPECRGYVTCVPECRGYLWLRASQLKFSWEARNHTLYDIPPILSVFKVTQEGQEAP